MAKDMYIHTEIQLLKCNKCGKEFEGYNSQNLKSYNRYCSLDCEYYYTGRNHNTRKHSLELKKLILQFSLDHEDISARRMAKIFGVSKDMPSNIIKQYGNRKPKKLLEFNRDYFSIIDTEENARRVIVYLYDNSNIYLDRKYEVAKGLIAKEVVKFGE